MLTSRWDVMDKNGTTELADDGATQVHPHTQDAYIGLKNPTDYPTVAGRPHGS